MLRVLALTLCDRPSGTVHSLRTLASGVRGHDVEVTLGAPGGTELEQWWRDAGLAFRPLALPARSGFTPAASSSGTGRWRSAAGQILPTVASIAAIGRVAADVDVLHSNWLFTHVDVAAAGSLRRTPTLVEMHDIVPDGPGRRVLTTAVRAAGATVAVSTAVRDQLPPPARHRVSVVHQGVDTDVFRPGPPDPATRQRLCAGRRPELLVAVIGRLDPAKRIDIAIDAVARARARGLDVQLAIVGSPGVDDGGHAELLRTRAATALPDSHVFVGETDDVPTVLRSVDALLVPSDDEPFGLIALEALATALPVVVRDAGGLREFVRHDVDGLRATDVDAFVTALDHLARSPDLRRRLGAAGRAHAVADLGADRRADRMARIYRQLARPGGDLRRHSTPYRGVPS